MSQKREVDFKVPERTLADARDQIHVPAHRKGEESKENGVRDFQATRAPCGMTRRCAYENGIRRINERKDGEERDPEEADEE